MSKKSGKNDMQPGTTASSPGIHPSAGKEHSSVLFVEWLTRSKSQQRRKLTRIMHESFDFDDIVTLNVAGQRFQTFGSTLARYPSTLLGDPERRKAFYHEGLGEYFFNRHRESFEAILYFYQSNGRLYRPETVPLQTFVRELKFFDITDTQSMKYFWETEHLESETEEILPENRFQRFLWQLMECPESSVAAQIVMSTSICAIFISVVSFCLETVPKLQTKACEVGNEIGRLNFKCPFTAIEFICLMWFTLEFALRLLSCPSKVRFWKNFLNIIDFLAIVPFYVNLLIPGDGGSFSVLRAIRLVRVFSIFKLSRHSSGLKVLGRTLRETRRDFFLLSFFLMIIVILFSSAMHFVEGSSDTDHFSSIPGTFWFALITLTSVGYGDVIPQSSWGKLVSAFFMALGILVCALPMVIIVEKFDFFYRQDSGPKEPEENEKKVEKTKTHGENIEQAV